MKSLTFLLRGTTLAALLLAGYPMAQPDSAHARKGGYCVAFFDGYYCIAGNSDGKICFYASDGDGTSLWCTQ